MAMTNNQRVGKAMDLLKDGLSPFVEREMRSVYQARMEVSILSFAGEKDRLLVGKPMANWDVAPLLRLMWEQWNEVFRKSLGRAERSLVSELREHRNKWAHPGEPFSSDDAERALDSAQRLLKAVSSPQADEVGKLRMELRQLIVEEQGRNARQRTTGTVASGPTRKPHEDAYLQPLHWDASPSQALPGPRALERVREPAARIPSAPVNFFEAAHDHNNPILIDDRDPSAPAVIERGVRLFRELAAHANARRPTGIGYAQFVAHVNGVDRFNDVVGHPYGPSDTEFVIRLAVEVTDANPGRIPVGRDGVTIQAGMDSFIWNSRAPFDRPLRAWESRWSRPPYTHEDWLKIFPQGERRLHERGA